MSSAFEEDYEKLMADLDKETEKENEWKKKQQEIIARESCNVVLYNVGEPPGGDFQERLERDLTRAISILKQICPIDPSGVTTRRVPRPRALKIENGPRVPRPLIVILHSVEEAHMILDNAHKCPPPFEIRRETVDQKFSGAANTPLSLLPLH